MHNVYRGGSRLCGSARKSLVVKGLYVFLVKEQLAVVIASNALLLLGSTVRY
jgi:hypothetical protein